MSDRATAYCPTGCGQEVPAVVFTRDAPGPHMGGGEVPLVKKRTVVGGMCPDCVAKAEAADRARAESKSQDRLRAAGLPATLRASRADGMDTDDGRGDVITAAREWAAADQPGGLCLFGPVGAGKTRLAAAATLALLRLRSVRWVSTPILLANIGASFGDDARARAVADITGNRALVLDDLDKVNPSEWAKAQLFAAIDSRVQAGAPLLVTTNLSPGELAGKLGDPIASRIAGYCRVLELRGRDYRLGGSTTHEEDH